MKEPNGELIPNILAKALAFCLMDKEGINVVVGEKSYIAWRDTDIVRVEGRQLGEVSIDGEVVKDGQRVWMHKDGELN